MRFDRSREGVPVTSIRELRVLQVEHGEVLCVWGRVCGMLTLCKGRKRRHGEHLGTGAAGRTGLTCMSPRHLKMDSTLTFGCNCRSAATPTLWS